MRWILYFLGLAIGITAVSFIIYQNSCGYQKYLIKYQQVSTLEEVNKNFYGNLYLLGVGIRIICDDIPVKYGQIKNGVEIPIQNMDIVEHNIK